MPSPLQTVLPSSSSPCGDKKRAKINYFRAKYDANNKIKPKVLWVEIKDKKCKKLNEEDHVTSTEACFDDIIAKNCGLTCGRCPGV